MHLWVRLEWLAVLVVVCAGGAPIETRAQERPPQLPVSRLADPQGGAQAPPATGQPTASPKDAQKLPVLPVTQLEERQRDADAGRTFSLRFAQPLPIRDVLLLLVRNTSYSVVTEPGVEGMFIGELKDVTLREALDLVLHPVGLDYALQNSFIRVFPRRTETRLFDVNIVMSRRSAQRSFGTRTALTSNAASGTSARITSMDEGDLFDEISSGLGTLLSDKGRFNLDRKAGLLQATDYPDRLDRIALYLEAVQLRAHRQVQIQARVLEVALDERHSAGVDWAAAFRAVTPDARAVTAAAIGVLTTRLTDFDGLVKALGEQGSVNVLATPRVLALNNTPALMRIGTQDVFFVPRSRDDPSTSRATQTAGPPQTVLSGLTLAVTPQIAADGIIQLSIMPSITERASEVRARNGEPAPVLSVREADTVVRLADGETAVMSGLLHDRLEKIETRGFAGLFRPSETRKAKTELIILLTPTVVLPGTITPALD